MKFKLKFKRLIPAVLLLAAAGCGKTYKDIDVTSFELVSVTPSVQDTSAARASALVKVGLSNPIVGFELSDIRGVLNVDGAPCAIASSDQLTVSGKSEKVYSIPMEISIPEGSNIFELLKVLKSGNPPALTLDASGKVAIRGGMGLKLNRVIQLDSLVDMSGAISGVKGMNFKNFILDEFDVNSVEPLGRDRCRILFRIGITNPYVPFELSGIRATLKLDSVPAINLSSQEVVTVPRGGTRYFLSLDGSLADGFNPCSLLGLVRESGRPVLSADFTMRIGTVSGIGKTFSWKDIRLY